MNERDEELVSQLMKLLSESIPLTREAKESAENAFRTEIQLARMRFQNRLKEQQKGE